MLQENQELLSFRLVYFWFENDAYSTLGMNTKVIPIVKSTKKIWCEKCSNIFSSNDDEIFPPTLCWSGRLWNCLDFSFVCRLNNIVIVASIIEIPFGHVCMLPLHNSIVAIYTCTDTEYISQEIKIATAKTAAHGW